MSCERTRSFTVGAEVAESSVPLPDETGPSSRPSSSSLITSTASPTHNREPRSRARQLHASPLPAEEIEELVEQLEEAEEAVDSHTHRHAIRRTRQLLPLISTISRFGRDDLAQQIVGGIFLSAPFIVTDDVWMLAASMNGLQTVMTIGMAVAIGYGTLYRAEDREADTERAVAGVPLRFLSLLVVSYTSASLVAFMFNAPAAFGVTTVTTFKAICISTIFSVVGAATADSLFSSS